MTIEEILSKEENQTFDRKSINISPKDLAIPIVAFANADGGDIAIGITDRTKRIEGIDFETKKLNELLRVPFDFCNPTIKVGIEKVPCVDEKGRENHVLVMHIDASPQVHANQADEAIAYLDTQVKEKTYLGPDGTFVTDEEYPKFVRQELIVNAVTHRAYSITGTDIQIKMFDDHIVVESPGKLPGLVRADNIRFTHFSRNPKIAEFLKNYKFVKEFGEGVNRMCNELEQVGLKNLVYHTNAFMLQAVIYNSKVGKTIVEKTADSLKKLAVAVNKSLIDYQKPAIGEEKSAIDDKKSAVDMIKPAIEQQKYNEPSKANILKVYDEIEKNQIFGTKEIKEILDCSPSTARAVMTKLRDMKVVKAVNGKGKGKYVFIE